jgi:LysM repeat protein
MRMVRQVLPGLLIALVSILLILGGLTLSFAEGNTPVPAQTHTRTRQLSATFTTQFISPTTPATPSPTPLPLTVTFTPSSSPTECPPPAGWVAYVVKSGDTLEGLVARYHTSTETFLQANCLVADIPEIGSTIFVPPLPTVTSEVCGPPVGWVQYHVQPGDTLYHLSVEFGVTVQELQHANCMGTSTLLVVGKLLYVPPWAPTPPTPTYPFYFTETPTWTVIVPGTSTPTPTDTDTPTETPTLP